MIRVWVEGDRQAMFRENERITVCREVIDGEYIVDERECLADELWKRFRDGDDSYPLIFLEADQFRDVVKVGTDFDGSCDIFRVMKVERTTDALPDFVKRGI